MKTFKEIQQESRGHKILASKLASMDRIKRGVGPEDKSNDVPFEPDAPKKNPSATAGKYGQGYSTARHLARQGLKSVSEEVDLNEAEMTHAQVMKKIKDGTHEAVTDVKPGKHVELRHTGTGKTKMVYVKHSSVKEEVELDESSVTTGEYFKKHFDKAMAAKEAGDTEKFKKHYQAAKTARYGMSSAALTKHKDSLDKFKSLKEETEGASMSMMEQYLAAIEGKVDFRDALAEKKLTPAEMKKREEVAKAIERENPGMDMSKKMAIATATAKKVAEEAEEIDEAKLQHSIYQVGVGTRDEGGGRVHQVHRVTVTRGDDEEERAKAAVAKHYGDTKHEITSIRKGLFNRKHPEVNKGISEEVDLEEKAHTVPKTAKEKALAKLAPPHDKITHADVMVGRGVKKEEMSSKEKMKRGLYIKDDIEQIDEADQPVSVTVHYKHKDGKTNSATHFTAQNAAEHEASVKKAGGTITGRTLNYASGKKEHRSMNEDVEQIDEISKATLASYVKKANSSTADNAWQAAGQSLGLTKDEREKHQQTAFKKTMKRMAGVSKAADKLAKEEFVSEGMISYTDFRDKIEAHKKAGHKVVDDKYSKDKAHFTSIDKEGIGRKLTHTASGTKVENLGKVAKVNDDEDDSNETETRGRGRPAGSKSGARRH